MALLCRLKTTAPVTILMQQQDRIMDGDLQTLGLQSVLKMLALSGKTGTLFVRSGPETLSISLRKGQVVAQCEDGVPQPDILSMLCLVNRLDPPRAQAIREMSHGNAQIALAMLVERRWMHETEMQQRLEFAVTQSISHALRWVDGNFEFYRNLMTMESRMRPLDVDSVLLEALRQADEWEELTAEMGGTRLTPTTVARWLSEVNNDDVRSFNLRQDHIDVLCLANGELPLQAMALVLLTPESRIARIMTRLLDLNLVEVIDQTFERELQQDLSNIIIKCQHVLLKRRQSPNPEQYLLGLITILAECINALLVHHGKYAKKLRGRGQLPRPEITAYLQRRFAQPLQLMAKQQYPILETTNFVDGRLDCTDILTLNRLVKGRKLQEFYWQAVQGLAVFLREIFATLLRDEIGNSRTTRQLNQAWCAFLTEIQQEIQKYHQIERAFSEYAGSIWSL